MVVNYDMLTGADSCSRTSQRRGRARRRKQATEGMRLSSVQRTSKKNYVTTGLWMLIAWEKLSVFLLFLCGSYEGSSDVYSFREDSLDSYAISAFYRSTFPRHIMKMSPQLD